MASSPMLKAANSIVWDIDLSPMIGKVVKIETRSGHYITPKLTAIEFDEVMIGGQKCGVPRQFILDDDQRMDIRSVKSIIVAPRTTNLSKPK